jgi:hypothetical protein
MIFLQVFVFWRRRFFIVASFSNDIFFRDLYLIKMGRGMLTLPYHSRCTCIPIPSLIVIYWYSLS